MGLILHYPEHGGEPSTGEGGAPVCTLRGPATRKPPLLPQGPPTSGATSQSICGRLVSLGSAPGFSLLVSPRDLGRMFLLLGTAQTGEAEIGLHLSSLTDTCVHASSVTWSCPTLCDPKYCSPPGSSVHGILQARILEWVAISSSKGSSQPRDRNCVSCLQAASLPLSQQGRPLTDTDQLNARSGSG